jgi:Tfp pilus assembly protein PilF
MAAQPIALTARILSLIVVATWVSACSTLVPQQPATGAAASLPGSADAERSAAPGGAAPNAASVALLERSREERAAGRYDAAAATVERALRIDPDDPALWLELAEINLAQGDGEQANSMARKALTLAGDDRAIAARAERLVRR